jgi:predicted lipid-binding transport protein (Tim44 family)
MARILLLIAAVIIGFMLLGTVISLVAGILKWALIIGVIALAIMALSRIFNSRHSA